MRRVFPSFDEPLYKIPWRISLRVPKADAAYFNTPIEATEDAGDMKLVRFAETKPLPSYLLAFGVGPFERVDAGRIKSGAPVGIVVTKGKTSWAKYSAQSSPRIMDILEDWFQIPYHYPKLDLIEVPLGDVRSRVCPRFTHEERDTEQRRVTDDDFERRDEIALLLRRQVFLVGDRRLVIRVGGRLRVRRAPGPHRGRSPRR